MDYRRFDSTLIVRLDPGEEVTAQLRQVACREHIRLASVSALGAVGEFEAGVYHVAEKRYDPRTFRGAYEIVSLTGTVSAMNGEYYAHLHISAAGPDGAVVGGHLNRAVISATCELVITVIPGAVDRRADEVTGLNIFDF